MGADTWGGGDTVVSQIPSERIIRGKKIREKFTIYRIFFLIPDRVMVSSVCYSVVVVGDTKVGKTQIINKLANRSFSEVRIVLVLLGFMIHLSLILLISLMLLIALILPLSLILLISYCHCYCPSKPNVPHMTNFTYITKVNHIN